MKRNTYFMDEELNSDRVDVKYLKRLLKQLLKRKKAFFIALFLLIASSLTALLPPVLIRYLVSTVMPMEEGRTRAVVLCALALFVVGALTALLPYFHKTIMGRLGQAVISDVRREIFSHLQELPFDYYDSRPAGKISIRVTEYVNELSDFFTDYLLNFIVDLLKLFSATLFMLALSPIFTAVVYCAILPIALGIFLIKRQVRKLFRKHRAKNSNRNAFLVESIMGEKIIKSFNRSEYNRRIYSDLQNDCAKSWMKIVRRNELNSPVSEFFWNAGILAIYFVAFSMISKGDAGVAGVVIAFLLFIELCAEPLLQLGAVLQQLSQVSANLERIYETVDTPVSIRSKEGAVELRSVEGAVEYQDVTFGYEEGVNVLEHFSLKVKKGEKIALVGPTGAGKTTVINLLTRFYDVKEGAVLIDSQNVRDVTLSSLRKQIGVLMQEPFLFQGSILENIRFGRSDATDEECIAAAKLIYADRVAARFQDGFYSQLKERGEGLSAGEKQLISFARIVLKDPRVIILDEATSSIDSETELLIQGALDRILENKTAFIVAHRLSTIRKADRILYIADKGIAEEGSHEELMNLKGRYYALNQRK